MVGVRTAADSERVHRRLPQRGSMMHTTRHLARLGAAALTATWLLAGGVTSASARPMPDPGPVAPPSASALPPGTAYGGLHPRSGGAGEYLGLFRSKAGVYDEYLARDDARAERAARLPSLPTTARARHQAAQTRSQGADGQPAWSLGLAGVAGLVLGAGLMGAGTRLRRTSHGGQPAPA